MYYDNQEGKGRQIKAGDKVLVSVELHMPPITTSSSLRCALPAEHNSSNIDAGWVLQNQHSARVGAADIVAWTACGFGVARGGSVGGLIPAALWATPPHTGYTVRYVLRCALVCATTLSPPCRYILTANSRALMQYPADMPGHLAATAQLQRCVCPSQRHQAATAAHATVAHVTAADQHMGGECLVSAIALATGWQRKSRSSSSSITVLHCQTFHPAAADPTCAECAWVQQAAWLL